MRITPRDIPSIDLVLKEEGAEPLIERYSRQSVLDALRGASETMKAQLRDGSFLMPPAAGCARNARSTAAQALLAAAARSLEEAFAPSLAPVINATGVALHTNLGRAPMAQAAVEAMTAVAGRYSNLEMNLATGERGHRASHVENILTKLTGAQGALAVNNNAASLYLIVDTLARGMEVIVSRGELIEIGGSFRLPEVLEKSGALLVEVGTTNRTYLRDYERALTESTGLMLKSHWSNFSMEGFVHTVDTGELAALGKRRGIATCEDLGSGLLIDLTPFGLPGEPTVQQVVSSGIDLVCFSGDKLLGGPQAGIILGTKELIARLAANPLMRALRPDKMTLSSLEATLRLYLNPERLRDELPVLRMLTRDRRALRREAGRLASKLKAAVKDRAQVDVVESTAPVGGGSLPSGRLISVAVAVTPRTMSEDELVQKLRTGIPPVVARTGLGAVLLDMRTLLRGDAEGIVTAIGAIFAAPAQ